MEQDLKDSTMKFVVLSAFVVALAGLAASSPIGCPPCVPIDPDTCATTTIKSGFPPQCGCGCP